MVPQKIWWLRNWRAEAFFILVPFYTMLTLCLIYMYLTNSLIAAMLPIVIGSAMSGGYAIFPIYYL